MFIILALLEDILVVSKLCVKFHFSIISLQLLCIFKVCIKLCFSKQWLCIPLIYFVIRYSGLNRLNMVFVNLTAIKYEIFGKAFITF